MIKKCLISGVLYLFGMVGFCQSIEPDTLERVQALKRSYEYDRALRYIEPYYTRHSSELYASWLYADLLFQTGRWKDSRAIYNKTLERHPGHEEVMRDYAIKLVEMGQLEEGIRRIHQILPESQHAVPLRVSLAKAYLWQGAFDKAAVEVKRVLREDPVNTEVLAVDRQLREIRASKFAVDLSYGRDDQPLPAAEMGIDGRLYLNEAMDLRFGSDSRLLETDDALSYGQGLWMGGSWRLNQLHTLLDLDGGVFRLPNNSFAATGRLRLQQRLFKHGRATLTAAHEPYLHTIASIDQRVLVLQYGASVGWYDEAGWLGDLHANIYEYYTDNNRQLNLGGWFMSPPVSLPNLQLRLGYGFSYNNTEDDRFTSVLSLDEIRDVWVDSTTHIQGVYEPYFTPRHQRVHSLVGNLQYELGSRVELGVNANVGIQARIMQPYLFLDEEAAGATVIEKDFYTERYSHLQLEASAAVAIDEGTRVRLAYTYHRSIFYIRHLGEVRLTKVFW